MKEMNIIIQKLKDGNYRVENLFFKNMSRAITIGNYKYFSIESDLAEEEKVEILDKYSDGLATYMISLINKWNNEKDSLPKDQWNDPKSVSKNAWIKKNDTKKIIYISYNQAISYNMFGGKHKTLDTICGTMEYSHNMAYTGNSIINQWFYDFCETQLKKEQQWFKENDPKQIKLKQLKDIGDLYRTCFDNMKLNDVIWNNKDNITEEEIDLFMNAYKAIEKCISEQTTIIEKYYKNETKE
jgi:hypothetical protein